MNIDAYVISLKKCDKLLNKIKNYNLNPILVNGVNGKKLSSEEIKENTNLAYSLFGPKSVIGCAISHIKTWKMFLESGKDFCFIFEDDVIFENNFLEEYPKALKYVPNDFDILYLGCLLCGKDKNIINTLNKIINLNSKTDKKINSYIKIPEIALGTHSYVLSKEGAKKLINNIDTQINNHIDVMIMKLYFNDEINVYALNNRIAFQTSTDELNSENVSNKHPLLITNILSNYEVDKKIRLHYIFNLSLCRIGNIVFSISSISMIILGLFFINIPIQYSIIFYLLLSSLDLYYFEDVRTLVIHGILFLLPSVFFIFFKFPVIKDEF